MERPDRMPAGMGASPGAAPGPPATALRGTGIGMAMPDNNNPSQARRPPLNTAPSNGQQPPMMPLPPLPNGRNGPSPNGNPPPTPILTPAQVISLTREAMQHALENESQAVDVGPGLKSGVTIDLSRKGIQKLPEEVVDIVKNELERLALSHNQLSSLPARFAECVSLRYLNIRGNQIKEFPLPLCELKSLEILDLGRNQLRVLPPDIARLSSLKVLSIPKNQIRELPVCLAEMTSLQVLKFDGNPISFPPRDALQIPSPSPSGEGSGREGEMTDLAITAHIKKFMKLHVISGRDAEATGDESSEGTDTPRMPLRRMPSGRFPIKVSSSDVSDMRIPGIGTRPPPPIPSRSHYRGLSQQSTTTRRPGVMPLTIGNINERGRSNSETLMHSERSSSRQRRMGILAKKAPSDLGTLDEVEGSNRWSHYRGLSHGSAMQGTQATTSKSPATPTDSLARPVYVRRLSVLPERRRESKIFDPVIEAAKGILYSVFQIHPMIQMLMTLTNDGSAKRSSLEIVFYNTNSHVEELEQEIQKHDMAVAEDEEGPFGDNANVHRACQTLVGAYGHVCTLLADNIDTFVNNGDARYIRTLLMLIYNSIMELRVTLSSVSTEHSKQGSLPSLEAPDNSNTIKPYFREAAAVAPAPVPAPQKPGPPRNRSGPIMHNPSNLRVATDIPVPYNNAGSRTARLASATPRSNDSFPSSFGRDISADFSEEDAQFDKIYLALQRSTDVVLHILPNFNVQLTGGIRNAIQQRAPSAMIRDWKNLIAMCNDAIQQTEILKNRLSLIKLKDPGVRSHAGFWSLCSNFISAWTKMASKIKSEINTIPLPPDTRARLRPIHQSMKETTIIIMNSPWNYILRPAGGPPGSFPPGVLSPTTPQVPITPQSAALGPAMQATVATPQTGSFAAVFQGNVFDRADTLMANPGISMSSRTGTMSRGHSGFNSLSSISSMSSDGVPTPSSAFSPSVQLGSAPFRMNGGKVAL
ncbi:RAM signaling pathway domain-containing protein [Trichoderma sp. SZMC 28015]